MSNSLLICSFLSVVRASEFLGRKLHFLLHGTCTVHLPEPCLQPYLCGGGFCILWSTIYRTERKGEAPCSKFLFFFQMSGFGFFSVSLVLFLKGDFCHVVVPLLVILRRWRFFFQLFCCFFFPCLLSSCGHPNQLLQGLIIQCDCDASARLCHVPPGGALQRGAAWFSHLFPLFSASALG